MIRNLSVFGILGGGTDSAPRKPIASAGTPLIAPMVNPADGPPLVPIVVPASGAFSPAAQPVLTAKPAPTAPFTQPPLRPIKLPTVAELDAQIAKAFKSGASAAQIRPLAEKLLRAKAREAAKPTVPGLPGTAGKPLPVTPRTVPVGIPGAPPIVIATPIPGVPSADTAAERPAGDVAEKAGGAVGGRIVKDVLTLALLTSPAWLTVLFFPRRP